MDVDPEAPPRPDEAGDDPAEAFRSGLAEVTRSTDRLLATVDRLDDDSLRQPTVLPGWTRAHVLTHVARQADGLVNLATWARTGVETPMYASREAREADIAAGEHRTIGDVRLDLNDSAERLLETLVDFPPDALGRPLRLMSGTELAGWGLPYARVREVEIHHVDLAAGYWATDWEVGFVRRTLTELAAQFRSRGDCPVRELRATDGSRQHWEVAADGPVLSGPAPALLAWLTGRPGADGLALDEGGDVPTAPRWT